MSSGEGQGKLGFGDSAEEEEGYMRSKRDEEQEG